MNYNQSTPSKSLVSDGVIHYKLLLIFFISLISLFGNRLSGQCSSSEVQVEIFFQTSGYNVIGEGIKIVDVTNDLEVYCEEFVTIVFTDTICINENSVFNIYGYDSIGENSCGSSLRINYISNPNNCGPQSDSILIMEEYCFDGFGQVQCNQPISYDELISSFITPSVSCSVSISGQIKTFTDQPVENVTVVISANHPDYPKTVMTNANGEYEFTDNPSGLDYEIESMYEDDLTCGLSILDLILTQRHILGFGELNPVFFPYNHIAADVDNNGAITFSDIIELNKLLLGVYEELPSNNDWTFVDESQFFGTGSNPFEFEETIEINNLTNDTLNQNFVAIKIGDVDGSCLLAPNFGGDIVLETDDQMISTGDTIEVGVYSNNFIDVHGLQFTLSHAGLNLIEVIAEDLSLTNGNYLANNQEGYSNFAWFDTALIPVTSDDILFKLVFEATEDVQLLEVLDVNSDVASAEAYTTDELLLNLVSMIINPDKEDDCTQSYLYFDAIDDRVVLPNQHTGNVDFTLECLFLSENTVDNSTNTFHRLFTLGTSNRMEIGDQLGELHYFNGSSASFGPNIRDGKWHHFAFVRSGEEVFGYIDGIKHLDINDAVVDLTSLRIGHFDSGIGNLIEETLWKGGIDQIKLWDYALTEQEIQNSMFSSNLAKQDCGLIGYWAFEDGIANGNNQSISEVIDSSGNNNGILFDFELVGDTSNFVCHDSLVINYDPNGCCDVSLAVGVQCNIITLNSFPANFIDNQNLSYSWSSPNTDFEASVQDTFYVYVGDLNEITICIEATDGNCIASICDDIIVSQPTPPEFEDCPIEISIDLVNECEFVANNLEFNAFDPCVNSDITSECLRSDGLLMDQDFPLGITDIICSATSITGLTSTCEFSIIVNDIGPPACFTNTVNLSLDQNGLAVLTANMVDDGSFDICSEVELSLSQELFTCNDIGDNNVTLIVTDNSGNQSSCVTFVIVVDITSPTCVTNDISLSLNSDGLAFINASMLDGGSTDQCEQVNLEIDADVFNCNDIGDNVVTLFVTDNLGNSSSCSGVVTVVDITSPICVTNDITLFLDASGLAFIDESLLDGGIIDECGAVNYESDARDAFRCNDIGDNIVTLVVTDNSGNSSSCTGVVTVEDNTSPICITKDIILSLDADGIASINASMIDGGSSDECEQVDFETDAPDVFTCNDIGDNIVTLSVTDNSGNLSSCSAVVVIEDNIAPVISCSEVTVTLDQNGIYEFTVDDIIYDATDNCDINSVEFDNVVLTCDDVFYNYTIYAFDFPSGLNKPANVDSCSNQVVILDDSPPICNPVPTVRLLLNQNGVASIDENVVVPFINDNCGIEIINISQLNFTCDDIGVFNVPYSSSDNQGLECISQISVNVIDNIAPICEVEDVFIPNPSNQDFLQAEFSISALDNCENVLIASSVQLGDLIECGSETIVDVTVSDDSNNLTPCSFTIRTGDCPNVDCTVELDVELGQCGNISANAITTEFSGAVFYEWFLDGDIIQSSDVSMVSATLSTGSYQLCIVVSDGECTSQICEEINIGSLEVFFENCPPNQFIGDCVFIYDPSNIIAFRECDQESVEVISQRSDGLDFSQPFPIGTTTVTFSTNDPLGPICEFSISIFDNTNPECISVPSITAIINNNGNAIINVQDLDLGSFDNCGSVTLSPPQIIIDCDFTENQISYFIEDETGRITTCFVDLVIFDDISPVCNLNNAIVFLDQNGIANQSVFDLDNNSSDNCSNIFFEPTEFTFDCSDIGAELVTITVSDQGNNVQACSAIIEVVDNIAPTCTMSEVELNLNGEDIVEIGLQDIMTIVTDNCQISDASFSTSFFTCDNIGSNDIQVQVTDDSQNQVTCNITVLINGDGEFLECDFDPIEVIVDEMGTAVIDESNLIDFINEGCLSLSLENGLINYSCTDIGTQVIQVQVMEGANVIEVCEVQVIITDDAAPLCEDDSFVIETNGEAEIAFNIDYESTDNCSVTSIEYSIAEGTLLSCSSYDIVASVSDESGNTTTCNIDIEVIGCSECCRSESEFDEIVKEGFELVSDFDNDGLCSVTLIQQELMPCQYVTEVIWGDSTEFRGMLGNESSISHQYTSPGIYEICTKYEELSSLINGCFESTICDTFEILDNCTIKKSRGDINDSGNLSVWPNPMSNRVNVSYRSNIQGNQIDEIQIVDLSGRLLSQYQVKDVEYEIINLEDLPKGVYILVVHYNNSFSEAIKICKI